ALLRRRPDVRAAERQIAAATARIGVAAADLYPTVTLGGSVSNVAGTLGGLFSSSTAAYSLGPLITWTFPNISLARAHVKEARALTSSALATFDATVLQALQEAEQALTTYGAELDRHVALAAAEDRADEALRLAQIQYGAGAASALDLLTAESTQVAAAQASAASDQAIAADQVAVFQALGGGWEDAPPVIPPPVAKR
nr:TolC family protein [Pseudomonadota bacterium]